MTNQSARNFKGSALTFRKCFQIDDSLGDGETGPQGSLGSLCGVVTGATGASGNPNRHRANSLSSSTSSSTSSFASCSPTALSTSPGSNDCSNGGGSNIKTMNQQPPRRALIQDRSRHDSGGSIFKHRSDYSSFNVLPKHKVNSYHIKVSSNHSNHSNPVVHIMTKYMLRVPY